MLVSLPRVALPPAPLPFDRLAIESCTNDGWPGQLAGMHVCHSAATTTAASGQPLAYALPTVAESGKASDGDRGPAGSGRSRPMVIEGGPGWSGRENLYSLEPTHQPLGVECRARGHRALVPAHNREEGPLCKA